MSRGQRRTGKSKVNRSKNPIKQRLERVEKAISEGVDHLIEDNRGLHHNDMVIAEALETHDTTIAAFRALLVEKGVITDEELDSKRAEIDDIRTKVREEAERKADEAAEEAAKKAREEEEAADAALPDKELTDMHDAAVKAGEDSSHPEGAFIFGG